jgi:hypothetical protein
MTKIKTFLGAAALLVSTISHAGTSSGTVQYLYIHAPNASYSDSTHGVVMFKAGNQTGAAGCSMGHEWAITLDTVIGKTMHKTLLTAIAAGKTITVVGNNDCDDWNDRERPYYIRVNG